MHYFALHVKTGSEIKIRKRIEDELGEVLKVFCPMRELMIRKKGKTRKELTPLFGGYLFIMAEKVNAAILSTLKGLPDFFQVLPSNKEIKPVRKEDLEFLHSLFKGKQTVPLSKAKFDENNRIQIIDGPLKGMEGLIVKVDRRKGRAKISVKAFGKEHLVDLGFERIQEQS